MRTSLCLYPLLCCLALLAGCSTNKLYESAAPKNLTLHAQVNWEGGQEAIVGVFRANSQCPTDFLGQVAVREKPLQLGLETGHKIYLKFIIVVSWSASSSRSIVWGTYVTPRPGAQYVGKLRYVGGQYDFALQEIGKGGAVVRLFGPQKEPCVEDI